MKCDIQQINKSSLEVVENDRNGNDIRLSVIKNSATIQAMCLSLAVNNHYLMENR